MTPLYEYQFISSCGWIQNLYNRWINPRRPSPTHFKQLRCTNMNTHNSSNRSYDQEKGRSTKIKRMEYGHPCQLYLPCLLAAKPSPCLIIQNLSISSGLRPGMRPAIRSHLQRPTPRHLVSVVRTSHLKELPCLDCVTLASPQGTFLFIGFS